MAKRRLLDGGTHKPSEFLLLLGLGFMNSLFLEILESPETIPGILHVQAFFFFSEIISFSCLLGYQSCLSSKNGM